MVAADAKTAIIFSLSPGQLHDAPQGRSLIKALAEKYQGTYIIMDKAYQDNKTRQLVMDLGFEPVVPPKSNRIDPWQYDKEMYKKRNEVERLFRRIKAFRRIFSRFDKLDVMYSAFITFTLIIEAIN